MEVTFSAATLTGFAIAFFAGCFSNLVFWIIWRRKTGAGCFPMFSGIIAF